MTKLLWAVQGLLALAFLFAGVSKFVMSVEEMTAQMPPLPMAGAFLRFIGAAEVLGPLGLVLPGLLKIRPGLPPLAAAGLTIIMMGATVLTAATGGGVLALIPLAVGVLAAFVAYGRRDWLKAA